MERQRRQLTGAAATQAQLSQQEADLARRDRDLKVRRQSSLLLLPPVLLFFPFFATSSAPAAVAVGVASISQDGDDVEFGLSIVIVNTLGASTNVWGNHVCYLHSVLMTSMCDTCKHLLSVMVATIRCMHILELIMIL